MWRVIPLLLPPSVFLGREIKVNKFLIVILIVLPFHLSPLLSCAYLHPLNPNYSPLHHRNQYLFLSTSSSLALTFLFTYMKLFLWPMNPRISFIIVKAATQTIYWTILRPKTTSNDLLCPSVRPSVMHVCTSDMAVRWRSALWQTNGQKISRKSLKYPFRNMNVFFPTVLRRKWIKIPSFLIFMN